MSTYAENAAALAGGAADKRGQAEGAQGVLTSEPLEAVAPSKVFLIRLALSLAALLLTYIAPPEVDRVAWYTHATLLSYTVYAGLVYLYAVSKGEGNFTSTALMWIDMGSYVLFISLSGGVVSIYYYFFFFSIFVASFRGGFASGLKMTALSALFFALVGYALSSPEDFELHRLLLRTCLLLVLGYMIAVWGGSEMALKRRLALLRSISKLNNPRFGVGQTVCSVLESVRKFFGADTCLLVTQDPESMVYLLRRADAFKPDRAVRPEKLTGDMGLHLAHLLVNEAVAVVSDSMRGGDRRQVVGGCLPDTRGVSKDFMLDQLARLIGDVSYLSVPWRRREGGVARLYVTSCRVKFDQEDLDFLLQVVEQAVPLIENIELLDRMASTASGVERRKISRDLHDSTIQPYIGLKMGLESVCRKASADNPLAGDLRELLARTEMGLADLRFYVRGLKREANRPEEPALAAAVRECSEQFTRLWGTEVTCDVEPGLAVGDRLSAELLQIVREGLSNVHRHARARAATLRLFKRAGSMVIEVENEAGGGEASFTPRSIRERAEALGGKAWVDLSGGRTLVCVEIPL